MHTSRGRTRARASLAAVVAAVGLVASGCLGATAPPPPAPTVIVYGDSLITQSKPYIQASITSQRGSWQQVYQHYPGTALCDWLDRMRTDAKSTSVKVVVIEFSGNDVTSCMAGAPAGSQAWIDKYQTDAATAAAIWKARGVKVLFVGPPAGVCTAAPHPLDAGYQAVAAGFQMSFTNAAEMALTVVLQPSTAATTASTPDYDASTQPETALTAPTTWPCTPPTVPTAEFAFEMPCRSTELTSAACVSGLIAVRDGTPDAPGGHFTASGASRFGQNIGAQAIRLMS